MAELPITSVEKSVQILYGCAAMYAHTDSHVACMINTVYHKEMGHGVPYSREFVFQITVSEIYVCKV